MRFKFPFLAALFFCHSALAIATDHCESKLKPLTLGLSALWAQELVGADITAALPAYGPAKIDVAILDLSFAGYKGTLSAALAPDPLVHLSSLYSVHGVAVATLLAHPQVGVSRRAQLKILHSGVLEPALLEGLALIERQKTAVVNMSLAIRYPSVAEKINALAETGVVIVTSAGNSAPRDPYLDETKASLRAIVVGSVELNGERSVFSQEGENVALYAPGANELIYSLQQPYSDKISRGEETLLPPIPNFFGMTSAASPQVAGAVANVKALLPQWNHAKIKELLQKTGTPLPGQSGKFLLNLYKAELVARRLAEGWPQDLGSAKLYDFPAELASLRKKLEEENGSDCTHVSRRLDLLRSAFLLAPSKSLAEQIAQTYQSLALPLNALFFEHWAASQ